MELLNLIIFGFIQIHDAFQLFEMSIAPLLWGNNYIDNTYNLCLLKIKVLQVLTIYQKYLQS